MVNCILLMIKYNDYEEYFNKLNVTEDEASVLIGYLTALAEIGINNYVEKEIDL